MVRMTGILVSVPEHAVEAGEAVHAAVVQGVGIGSAAVADVSDVDDGIVLMTVVIGAVPHHLVRALRPAAVASFRPCCRYQRRHL